MQLIDEVIGYAKANAEAPGPCKDAWDAHRRNCVLIKAEIERLRTAARDLIDNIETGSYESTGLALDYLKALIADPALLSKGERS